MIRLSSGLCRSIEGWTVVAALLLASHYVQANALELMPMRMKDPTGVFHVTNKSNRMIRVSLNAYPARPLKDGSTTATLTPFPGDVADKLIRLRPSSFRLGANSSRLVNFKLLSPSTSSEFFVCAVRQASANEMANIRICSRWRPSP